jgi:hypothetical protein
VVSDLGVSRVEMSVQSCEQHQQNDVVGQEPSEEEASRSVCGDPKRLGDLHAEALRAMQSNSTDVASLNAMLRRLLKDIRIDIEAGELFVEWLNGKVNVLTTIGGEVDLPRICGERFQVYAACLSN